MTAEISTDLLNLVSAEAQRFEHNKLLIGDESVQHLQLIEDAYSFIINGFAGSKVNEVQAVLLQFMAGSKMQLATGFLTLLRGQGADSDSYVRKAIEQLLFGVNLFERPLAAEKWLSSVRTTETFKEYRDEFNIMDMLHISTYEALNDFEQKIVECLIDRYEMCCLSVHATPLAQGKKLSTTSPNGELGIWMHLVDGQDDKRLLSKFWFDADSHAQILMLYAELVERCFEHFKQDEWAGIIDRLVENHLRLLKVLNPECQNDKSEVSLQACWRLPKKSDRRKTKSKSKKVE